MSETVEQVTAQAAPVATQLHRIFADCTLSDPDMRYAFAAPWRQSGFIYATDGRICVRMKDDPSIVLPAPDGKPFADASGFYEEQYSSTPVDITGAVLRYRRCSKCAWFHGSTDDGYSFGSFAVRHDYLELIRRHGVTELFPHAIYPATRMAKFWVGEIEGLLMPYRMTVD